MKKNIVVGVTMSAPLVDVLLSLLPLRSPSLSLSDGSSGSSLGQTLSKIIELIDAAAFGLDAAPETGSSTNSPTETMAAGGRHATGSQCSHSLAARQCEPVR